MASEKAVNVATPSLAYQRMEPNFTMIRDILGGTERMRVTGRVYLPQHANESDKNYAVRLRVSTFTPLYKVTTENMTGRVFAEEILIEDADEQLMKDLENCDLTGRHVSLFARDVFQEALDMGITFIYVDYHKGLPTETQEQVQASGARPYFVHLKAENVLSVETDGSGNITRARFKEFETVMVEKWGQKVVERVRVVEPTRFELWEKTDSKTKDKTQEVWTLKEEGPMTLGIVPLIPVITNKTGPFEAKPPLLDVAYLNIKYFQCQSNYDNGMSVAMFPILAASGYKGDDPQITIGPKSLLTMEDPQGSFYFVEHTGAAIAAGVAQLEGIKADCVLQGARILMPRLSSGPDTTATQERSDETREICPLQAMSQDLSDALENALLIFLLWKGKLPATEPSVELRGSFEDVAGGVPELTVLANLVTGGNLTKETLWDEMKRRKVLSEDFDPEKEKELLSMGGMDLLPAPSSPGTPRGKPAEAGVLDEPANMKPKPGKPGKPGSQEGSKAQVK